MIDNNRILAMAVRAALLSIVDALEVWLGMDRTKVMRKAYRDARREYQADYEIE